MNSRYSRREPKVNSNSYMHIFKDCFVFIRTSYFTYLCVLYFNIIRKQCLLTRGPLHFILLYLTEYDFCIVMPDDGLKKRPKHKAYLCKCNTLFNKLCCVSWNNCSLFGLDCITQCTRLSSCVCRKKENMLIPKRLHILEFESSL
jgi:hypothetical protein